MMDLDLVVKYFPTEGQVGYIRYIGYYFMLNLTLGFRHIYFSRDLIYKLLLYFLIESHFSGVVKTLFGWASVHPDYS
jgi:hypothetical protein